MTAIVTCLCSQLAIAQTLVPLEAQPEEAAETPAAQTDEQTKPEHLSNDPAPPQGEPLDEKRDAPNFDGREPKETTVGEGLLWVPRVVLFPVYLTTEYLVRWPLGTAATAFERYHVLEFGKEVFTFRDGTMGIFPIFHIDRGKSGTLGIYSYADGLFHPAHSIKLTGDADFSNNWDLVLLNRIYFDDTEKRQLDVRLSLEHRDDFVYYGTGSKTVRIDGSRFGRQKLMAQVVLRSSSDTPGIGGWLSAEVSNNTFFCSKDYPRNICGDDNIANTADDRYAIDTPSGASFFSNGYSMVRIKLNAWADTRAPRPASGTGLRLDLFGRYGHHMGSESGDIHFFRYGGELGAFVDVSGGRQRVLGFRLNAELVEPVSDGQVPFAELITLGGMETMRGFLHARFHGFSAVVATIDYRYPIWSFLDGNIFVEVGNTFDPNFEDFDLDWLRGTAGIALRTTASRDISFDILLALGTSPLGVGDLRVDFWRFSLGTNLGF